MTQPDNAVPARGARPHLFGEPRERKASGQPDFGPSILATIDGTPARREGRSQDAAPLKRVLWMSAVALGVVAVYFGVKFGALTGASSSTPETLSVATAAVQPAPLPAPVAKQAEPAAIGAQAADAGASAAERAASIENVTSAAAAAPAPASSAESTAAASPATASVRTIQQSLAQGDASEPRKTANATKPVAHKESAVPGGKPSVVAKETAAPARVAVAPQAGKASTKAAGDGDAELLAAMLPHLKRQGGAPTSPAYERRCGSVTGDAAVECRARFCNGREGVDPACPSAVVR